MMRADAREMIGPWYKLVLELVEKVLAESSLPEEGRAALKEGIWLLTQARMQTNPARAIELSIESTFKIFPRVISHDSMGAYIRSPAFSGVLSGAARRAEAQEKWNHALDLAVAIRTEDQSIKQFDLEGEILSRWNSKLRRPRQLTKEISRWEQEGKLAPRRNK
jgi:hypothetical protein